MHEPQHITLIGCGNMGSALLKGWQSTDLDARYSVIEPHDIAAINVDHYRLILEAEKTIQATDMIIIAVKPQIMTALCTDLKNILPPTTPILSIAAGKTLSNYADYFTAQQPVIRAMPNTPAAIGKGITVMMANAHITAEHKALAEDLMITAGPCEWINDESLMNAVTALSGSGPAYIFHLIETLTEAGEHIGLSRDLAEKLARQTVIGSASLAEHQPEISAVKLREMVTSPGGTTEAALNVLMDKRLENLYKEALQAAKDRGEELMKS